MARKVLSHARNASYDTSIPGFLHPKMNELLVELAVVENEIDRLESQIGLLQFGLNHEQEAAEDASSHWQVRTPTHHVQGESSTTDESWSEENLTPKVAFESKAKHFISRVIKGEYRYSDVSLNDKMDGSRLVSNHGQEVVPKRGGVPKPVSPLAGRSPQSSITKSKERATVGKIIESLSKSLPRQIMFEVKNQEWQPNRLSEQLIKYLNFIYMRLLRTVRQVDLEKSGSISRSLKYSSIISRSFRADNPMIRRANIMQKNSRHQDPYGIFDVEGSISRDIGPYRNLVVFNSSSMDSRLISSPGFIPLFRKLRVLMTQLQTLDLKSLSADQKLAFWINMYNACIMHDFLQYGIPSSPEMLLALTKQDSLNIGGKMISAYAIEHFILGKSTSSYSVGSMNELDHKNSITQRLFGLDSVDPNVAFALSCGTRSSPAVRLYTAENIMSELEKAKLDYLQASIVVTSSKKIAVPPLLHKNMLQFSMSEVSMVEWICHQLPISGSLRKSIVDCFRGNNTNAKLPSSVNIEELPHDFEFQFLLAAAM